MQSKRISTSVTSPMKTLDYESEGITDPDVPTTIRHAYCLVEVSPGAFMSYHLQDVVALKMTPLEPNGRTEPASRGADRIRRAVEARRVRGQW